MQRECERIHYELMKKENDYVGVVNLISSIRECNTDYIDMGQVISYMVEDRSLDDVLEIPLLTDNDLRLA